MNRYEHELIEFREKAYFLLTKAITKKAFIRVLQDIINDLGFSYFDITHTKQKFGLSYTFSSFPSKINEAYFSEVDYENDLTTKIIFSSTSPVYSSDILSAFKMLPRDVKQIQKAIKPHEVMGSFGLHDLFSIPIQIPDSFEKICFSILPDYTEPVKFKQHITEQLSRINILSNIIMTCIGKNKFYSRKELCPSTELSDLDILILKYIGPDSMRIKDIAQKIKKTESYVHSSVKKSKTALNKKTTAGAVAEALRLDIINFNNEK